MDYDVEAEIAEALLQVLRVRCRALSLVELAYLELLLIEDYAFAAILVVHVVTIRILGHGHKRGDSHGCAEIRNLKSEML